MSSNQCQWTDPARCPKKATFDINGPEGVYASICTEHKESVWMLFPMDKFVQRNKKLPSTLAAEWIAEGPLTRLHGMRVTMYSVDPQVMDKLHKLEVEVCKKFYSPKTNYQDIGITKILDKARKILKEKKNG